MGIAICSNCFNEKDKCNCEHKWFVDIDEGILECIKILNKKGYKTIACCESHTPYDNMYIFFNGNFDFGNTIPIPEGFTKQRKRQIIEHLYGRNCTNFEEEKEKHLAILLEWCNGLRDLNEVKDERQHKYMRGKDMPSLW